jgi:hypothetical protein
VFCVCFMLDALVKCVMTACKRTDFSANRPSELPRQPSFREHISSRLMSAQGCCCCAVLHGVWPDMNGSMCVSVAVLHWLHTTCGTQCVCSVCCPNQQFACE